MRKLKVKSEQELLVDIEREKQEIAKLEAQDESKFTDFQKDVSGKAVNIPLCRNHIAYDEQKLKELRANGLYKYGLKNDFVYDGNKTNL